MYLKCHECNRGGNGNDKDKCAAGWQVTEPTVLGCFTGEEIVGKIKKKKELTRSQKRYQRYLKASDVFENFREFLRWDEAERKRRKMVYDPFQGGI